jgi:hypothetical protein
MPGFHKRPRTCGSSEWSRFRSRRRPSSLQACFLSYDERNHSDLALENRNVYWNKRITWASAWSFSIAIRLQAGRFENRRTVPHGGGGQRFLSSSTWRPQRQHDYFNKRTTDNKNNIRRSTCLAHGWQHHIGKNWHIRAAASGGEYSVTDDGRVRPKHVLIEFEKWMCYIDGRKNNYSEIYLLTILQRETGTSHVGWVPGYWLSRIKQPGH